MISVLCIDDDPEILDLCTMYLEKSKQIKVTKEKSAKKALEILNNTNFDAIISDYRMPEFDGIALLKHVRTRSKSLPFFLLTGKGDEDVAMEAMNLGADYYIKKGGSPRDTFRDLEERIIAAVKETEIQDVIRDKVSLYECITDRSPFAIAVFDDDMRCRYANREFLSGTGEISDVIGKSLHDIFPDLPHPRENLIQWVRAQEKEVVQGIKTRDQYRWTFRYYDRPEDHFFIAVYGIPVK